MARPKTSLTDSAKASPLEAHVGFWLRFVSNQVSARFAGLLAAHGVTVSEWVALRTLYARTSTTHAELIDALGMTKGAASKLVTRLEAKGLASRQAMEGSARGQSLGLSAEGRRLLPLLAALADQNDAHFFGHLDVQQRDGLVALMQALVRHHGLKEVPVD